MSIALALAERIERSGGPRAGYFAWKTVFENSTTNETKSAALLAACRCATNLRDSNALRDVIQLWGALLKSRGVYDLQIGLLCKNMTRAGFHERARDLAAAELARNPTARATYLYARCLELMKDRRAPAFFADTIRRARREGLFDLERAAQIRRFVGLSQVPETRAEAVREAQAMDPSRLLPDDRLALAKVLLRAASRFARTTALGWLDEIVAVESPLLPESKARADRALRILAAHADDRGGSLCAMEVDRLMAILSRRKSTSRARAALAALVAVETDPETAIFEFAELQKRARDLLEGRFAPGGLTVWDRLFDVASAIREGSPGRATIALRVLEGEARLPNQTWTLIQAALAMNDPEPREAAAKLVPLLFARTPPRGWISVAASLSMAQLDELATMARRYAAAAGEPGSAEALGLVLTRSGWQLARDGERSRAVKRLREAKALSLPPGSEPLPSRATPSP